MSRVIHNFRKRPGAVLRAYGFWILSSVREECSGYLAVNTLKKFIGMPGNLRATPLFSDLADGVTEVVILSLWESLQSVQSLIDADGLCTPIDRLEPERRAKVVFQQPFVRQFLLSDPSELALVPPHWLWAAGYEKKDPLPRLERIVSNDGPLLHIVPIEDVVYFEAANKYVRVITMLREHLVRTSLADLLDRLDPDKFWQIRRGTVVRAAAITTAERLDTGNYLLTIQGLNRPLMATRQFTHLFRPM